MHSECHLSSIYDVGIKRIVFDSREFLICRVSEFIDSMSLACFYTISWCVAWEVILRGQPFVEKKTIEKVFVIENYDNGSDYIGILLTTTLKELNKIYYEELSISVGSFSFYCKEKNLRTLGDY